MNEEERAIYEAHRGEIVAQRPSHTDEPLPPYGWLRGFVLQLDEPIPNMDASNPLRVQVTVTSARDGKPITVSGKVQAVCESVEPLGVGAWAGVNQMRIIE